MRLSDLTVAEVRQLAANEAIAHLGLLKPSAVDTIMMLLTEFPDDGPQQVVQAYLSSGTQLDISVLGRLKLDAHRAFSVEAMNELSPRGIKRPGPSHRLTLSRARYSVYRYLSVVNLGRLLPQTDGWASLEYQVIPQEPCEACVAVNLCEVDRDNLLVLPPVECRCELAPITIGFRSRR